MKRVVAGIHSVREALNIRPKKINELWIREGHVGVDLEEFLEIAAKNKIPAKRMSQKQLDREVTSHQGAVAFTNDGPLWPSRDALQGLDSGFFFALDGFEDPHNVGSIVRSAWNLGALGVLLTQDRTASAGAPAAQKVASGAFEHVPVLEVSNLSSELKALQDFGFWVYGLSIEGSSSLSELEIAPKAVLVIGSEENGLRKPVAGACDALIKIPQAPKANSYNASVAGALAGYEFVRQRHTLKA